MSNADEKATVEEIEAESEAVAEKLIDLTRKSLALSMLTAWPTVKGFIPPDLKQEKVLADLKTSLHDDLTVRNAPGLLALMGFMLALIDANIVSVKYTMEKTGMSPEDLATEIAAYAVKLAAEEDEDE